MCILIKRETLNVRNFDKLKNSQISGNNLSKNAKLKEGNSS